jgi:Tfp pilus assembly protein PilV
MKNGHLQLTAQRRGFSLFEVVLSLSILLGALTAWSQLIDTGARAGIKAKLQTEAILRCESKLAEMIAGAEALETADSVAFDDDPEHWSWAASVTDGPYLDLLAIRVTATHTGGREDVSYTLTCYIRDPAIYEDAAFEASQTEEVDE